MIDFLSQLISYQPKVNQASHSIYNTGFEVILASLLGAFVAQLFKLVGTLIFKREFNFRILVETGGMPSSHSASMSALATSVALVDGYSSTTFAVAVGIALVVMYDAAGVRRSAGRMAGVLNKITKEIYSHDTGHVPEHLKELLGHTPFEVLVGAIVGILLSFVLHGYLS
jgi:acid phosphatase family membrane protein YuiD